MRSCETPKVYTFRRDRRRRQRKFDFSTRNKDKL